jgi:hypothetical protein
VALRVARMDAVRARRRGLAQEIPMQKLRTWVLAGGLFLLMPQLMGGCGDGLEGFLRDVSDEFDNLADDVDGDDDDDLEDFFNNLFDDDDD